MWRGLSLAALVACCGAFQPPEVTIETLKPKGIRISIPDTGNITLFAFHGNVNRAIEPNAVGTLTGEILEPQDGRWVLEETTVALKPGDVINYFVFITAGGLGYLNDNQKYTVPDEGSGNAEVAGTAVPVRAAGCKPSPTRARGRAGICSGDLLLRDDFDSLDEGLWQIQHKVPVDHPEYPFISYQRSTVSVREGLLRIEPRLLQDSSGFDGAAVVHGTLDLNDGCTGRSPAACQTLAHGARVLPPVVAGRLSHGLAFKYGEVRVRARLPRGDWLYPELLLEPFTSRYGSGAAAGLVKIAAARGNRQLRYDDKEFGNEVLYGGVVMNSECSRDALLREKRGQQWGEDFHLYSVRWAPDRITFSVDGAEWSRLEPGAGALAELLPPACRRHVWAAGGTLAPFDEEFTLSLGVAAGGISEFPDGSSSSDHPKPWRNLASKAVLRFWQDLDSWNQTWGQHSTMLVDYVEVVAL